LVCYGAAMEQGALMHSLGLKLGISFPSARKSLTRGQQIAAAKKGIKAIASLF